MPLHKVIRSLIIRRLSLKWRAKRYTKFGGNQKRHSRVNSTCLRWQHFGYRRSWFWSARVSWPKMHRSDNPVNWHSLKDWQIPWSIEKLHVCWVTKQYKKRKIPIPKHMLRHKKRLSLILLEDIRVLAAISYWFNTINNMSLKQWIGTDLTKATKILMFESSSNI